MLYCFVLAMAGGIGTEGVEEDSVVEALLGAGGKGDIELSMAVVIP